MWSQVNSYVFICDECGNSAIAASMDWVLKEGWRVFADKPTCYCPKCVEPIWDELAKQNKYPD